MKWFSFSLFLAGVTLCVVSCSRKLAPQAPCNFVQNGDLQRVSWNPKLPVHLYVHRSMPLDRYPEMESLIKEAVEAWNTVARKEVLRLESFKAGGSDKPSKDGYSMIYWMTEWDQDRLSEQARTTIYWSGSQIYEADVRINAKDHQHSFYVGHESEFNGVDFKSLMIHELGHVLGLSHNNTENSVMKVSLSDGLERRKISNTDIQSIRCEY